MALATWWQGDPDLDLAAFPHFHVRPADDDGVLAQMNRLTSEQVRERRHAGHRAYVGSIGDLAVTSAWVATRTAAIGELGLQFAIPAGDRYLWDFATLPEWQGTGLYPLLLHAIMRVEDADRFWILYGPENLPSEAEIQKAGFQSVGQLAFLPDGSIGLLPTDLRARARFGAALLGIPLLEKGLSPS
jgi:GNAT superfamily N-acetyltransferase